VPAREPLAAPTLRAIEPRDDAAVAAIIRSVMPEFGACGAGFAIHDAEVGAMCAAYRQPRSLYLVWEQDGRVLGGGGVAPLQGGAPEVCELKKMYFLREARGRGWGEILLRRLLSEARAHGFDTCYLETLVAMESARRLYARLGFSPLQGPMGATGHFACDSWFALDLRADRRGDGEL
jgi:putative acetyltransferase